MNADQAALTRFDGLARLFPLPNVVMFPHAGQDLHIFEPRYRQMTADALNGDALIALAVLREGWENAYDQEPAVEPVACLGRISQHQLLPDGRYNLRLHGLMRIRISEEIRSDKPYRIARAEPIPDITPENTQKLAPLRRRLAQVVLPRFEPTGPVFPHLVELFASSVPLGVLCDMLAYALPLSLHFQLALLLEPHVDIRADALIQSLQISKPHFSRKFPPEFSTN
ncbi:MAG: LON peptidase substrate-binding domain-containing protein [Bacteroidales bacterium]|nr:LON peptidase substrate-binding domain-containing protein [Bacteroidales bacterium]